ncbi:MAG: DUF3857 and transglutaminase domain-containing protein [FCB group bacterium]|nr:DUF3857 and transglutaminase domain-containing protein [FCB group bacterium]
MKRTIVNILIALFLVSCATTSFHEYAIWGKVPDELFSRSCTRLDSSAAACIVFDIGKITINTGTFDLSLEHHRRIQIFSSAGRDYADIRIPFWHDERVTGISAQTILPSGKIIKLKKSDIFEEGDKDGTRYKVFAIPGVQDQCIIEYQYELNSDHIAVLDPWYFQDNIPTEYSQFELVVPMGFIYNMYLTNSPVYDYKPEVSKFSLPNDQKCQVNKYSFSDLPAIYNEAFMTTPRDYMARLNIQLVEIRYGYGIESFIQNWKDFSDKFFYVYKPYMRGTEQLEDLADRITSQCVTSEDRIVACYNWVKDSLTTTRYRGYTRDEIGEVKRILSERSGSRVEKNLLLIGLLNSINIPAYPMLISTRYHGFIDTQNPRLDSFNHLVAYIDQYPQPVLLDTWEPTCPYPMLPPNDLSSSGLVLGDGRPQFKSIPIPSTINKYNVRIDELNLHETGDISGSMILRFDGYRNMNYRDRYSEAESITDFIKDQIFDEYPDVIIDSVDTTGISSDIRQPLTIRIDFTLSHFADVIGDQIYMRPGILQHLSENIFKRKERKYPIDYFYKRMNEEYAIINLPKGYTIEELPKPMKFTVPGHEYIRSINQVGRTVNYQRRLTISQTYFLPGSYNTIKKFYQNVVKHDNEVIVLSKVDE